MKIKENKNKAFAVSEKLAIDDLFRLALA